MIAKSTLSEFWQLYPDSEKCLKSWFIEASRATWKNPGEIKTQYRSASILKRGRVVFNIAGNKYRLLVEVLYKQQIIYVKFVGTHAQYDAIDVEDYNGEQIQGHKD